MSRGLYKQSKIFNENPLSDTKNRTFVGLPIRGIMTRQRFEYGRNELERTMAIKKTTPDGFQILKSSNLRQRIRHS